MNPTSSRTLHSNDESGMLSLSSLFVVLGMIIAFALMGNISKTVSTKLETQNAADAAATAVGTELARGMNAVTASNHLIGELQALVVLHHSLGGDELDGTKQAQRTPSDVQTPLRLTHEAALRFSQISGSPDPVGYDDFKEEPEVGATIRDSRIELKKVVSWAYVAHAAGALFSLLKYVPIVGPIFEAIGKSIVIAAMAFEYKAWQEWYTLNALEEMAKLINPVKNSLRKVVIPGLYYYTCWVAGVLPGTPTTITYLPGDAGRKAEEAAVRLNQKHDATTGLYPSISTPYTFPLMGLPVTPEEPNLRDMSRSQLVRASTPWIQHWRRPWMKFGEEALLMSRFKCHYLKWTNYFTTELVKRAKQEQSLHILVLRDLELNGADKTNEVWAKSSGSATADKHFCTMAFARRPAPAIAAFGYFRQPNPDGFVAFAQTMIYNANPQQPTTSRNGWQRVAGWDTLNWDNVVPEHPGPNPGGESCPIPNVPEPRVRLNWRAKLVPSTRLMGATLWQQGDIGEVLQRTPFFLPGITNTH